MLRAALLLSIALLPATASQRQAEIIRVVRHWIEAARTHTPGTIDQPLLDIAKEPAETFHLVRRHLRSVMVVDFVTVEAQNELLKRGAILHTDIALLLPRQAAPFTVADLPPEVNPYAERRAPRPPPPTLVQSSDGEFVDSAIESGHWWMARRLLTWIGPRPAEDPFVASWYRAIAARFGGANLFGNEKYHLGYALDVLPHDPVLLFYAGAMHEAYASARLQSVPMPRGAAALASPREEWTVAERQLRESVSAGGPVEAQVRLGRVLSNLGRHGEAVATLRAALPRLNDPRLQYLAALFLGSAEGALDHVDLARDSLARASELFPTAQAPVLALSELMFRTGNREAAIAAQRRLEQLPPDANDRADPWQEYHNSFALDANEQMARLRMSVTIKGRQ